MRWSVWFIQVDFSATPYSQTGSGRNRGKAYFPHIIVDFDLNAAMSAGLVKSLALDKRKEVAALPLDFKAERDEQARVVGLSQGQRVMLRAGVKKLQILEDDFKGVDPAKRPKLLVVCEETAVTPHVVDFLRAEGMSDDDVLAVDSNRTGMKKADWDATRERLFDVDRHVHPRVIVNLCKVLRGPPRRGLGRNCRRRTRYHRSVGGPDRRWPAGRIRGP